MKNFFIGSYKNNKIRAVLNFNVVSLLFFIIAIGLVIFSPISYQQIALALQNNYNKLPAQNTLTLAEWNNLDADFVWKEGDTMTGSLNMNGNSITNLATPTAADTDHAANVQYVQTAITNAGTAGGGDIYINWGRSDCPAGVDNERLYFGYAFSSLYSNTSGGSNVECLEAGNFTPAFTGSYADNLYPVVTGAANNLPFAATAAGKIVKCAVCHRTSGTCYVHYGNDTCPAGSGFSMAYNGFVLGSYGTNGGAGHNNPTERACVNSSFDDTQTAGGGMGAMWYGATITNPLTLGYITNSFIRCAVCCN